MVEMLLAVEIAAKCSMVATRARIALLMHSPAQPTSARLLSDGEGALTVMIFLVGLESSLECLRFDSLSVALVEGAIVGVVANELTMAGSDVCIVCVYVQRL